MTLVQIEQFVTIAEYKSISKAAEALYMNQSNLSRSINNLEKELAVKLFKRTATGVELTTTGEYCLPFSKRIIAHTKSITSYCSDISKMNGEKSNSLRLVMAAPNYDFLATTSFIFKDRYPGTALNANLIEASGNLALDHVLNNEADFAITTGYPFSEERKLRQVAERGLKPMFLGTLPTGLFLKSSRETLEEKYVDISKLKNLTLFILRPGDIVIKEFQEYFEARGHHFAFEDIVRASSYGYINRAISILGGFAFGTRNTDASNIYPGTVFKRFDPKLVPSSNIYAIIRNNEEYNPAIFNFLDIISEQLAISAKSINL